MDMNRIDAAIEAYAAFLPARDTDRLRFFRGLIEVQDRHAQNASQAGGYTPPAVLAAQTWYQMGKPVFLMAPVSLDVDRLVASLEDVSCYLVDHAGFAPATANALRFFDWRGCVDASDIDRAGSDPVAYIESVCESQGKDAPEATVPCETLALVLAYGLRPLLEPVALSVMSSLDLKQANENYNRPLACPVCGSRAAAATVGPTPSGASNGKILYCALCGTTWEFERIRCASCGTQNQGELHYAHLEDDDAHRLYSCNECGDYMRTVFQENLQAPFVFEVEDVVMTKLDMIAHDERFTGTEG